MGKSKINTAKGRRYSIREKEEVLAYIESVNAEKGRGGQTAAAKKFKISPLTVSAWVRHGATNGDGPAPVASASGPLARKLAKLQQLHMAISKGEKELVRMRREFDSIKSTL